MPEHDDRDDEIARLEKLARERYELACRFEREAEQARFALLGMVAATETGFFKDKALRDAIAVLNGEPEQRTTAFQQVQPSKGET